MMSQMEGEPRPASCGEQVDGKLGSNQQMGALIRASPKRYTILILFGLNAGNKSFQWIQIPASTVKISYFYGVPNYVANSLSVLFMLSFMLVSLPACFAVKSIGLRKAVLIGSFGTAIGSIIKCFSCHQDGLPLLFVGSTIVSLSEQFVFSIPARLASVWFPDHQVSMAVSMCMLGNQLGNALGFIIPQVILDKASSRDEIGSSLWAMFVGVAIVSSLSFVADYLLFEEAPELAPGLARSAQITLEQVDSGREPKLVEQAGELMAKSKQLLANKNYLIIVLVYAIVLGTKDSFATILNQMLDPLWPADDILVGNAGALMILAGALGLLLWGRLMDRLHRYLWINMFITLATTLTFILFAYVVSCTHSSWTIYLATTLIGFFQTAIMASGLELAVELTYPTPEMITSSIMNILSQLIGIPLIYLSSYTVDNFGPLAANVLFVLANSLALLMLPFIEETLNRQNAVMAERKPPL